VLTGADAFGDWHADAPGVWRHVTQDAGLTQNGRPTGEYEDFLRLCPFRPSRLGPAGGRDRHHRRCAVGQRGRQRYNLAHRL
jgi:hypothetical protein